MCKAWNLGKEKTDYLILNSCNTFKEANKNKEEIEILCKLIKWPILTKYCVESIDKILESASKGCKTITSAIVTLLNKKCKVKY